MAQVEEPHPDEILFKQMSALRDEIKDAHKGEAAVDPTKLSIAELHGKIVDNMSFMADLASLSAEGMAPIDDEELDDEEHDEDDAGDGPMLDDDEGKLITGLLADHRAALEALRSATEDGQEQAAYTRRMADCDRAIGIVNDLVAEPEA